MNSEKEYIITLNNKKYVIINMLSYYQKKYVYLTALDDFSDYIIGEILEDKIIEINDHNLLGKLIVEFSRHNK